MLETKTIVITPYSGPKQRMQKASELISLPDPLPECIVPVKGKLRFSRHFELIMGAGHDSFS